MELVWDAVERRDEDGWMKAERFNDDDDDLRRGEDGGYIYRWAALDRGKESSPSLLRCLGDGRIDFRSHLSDYSIYVLRTVY